MGIFSGSPQLTNYESTKNTNEKADAFAMLHVHAETR